MQCGGDAMMGSGSGTPLGEATGLGQFASLTTPPTSSRARPACAVSSYFGSITRYRPHDSRRIFVGGYGPWLENFLNEQTSQFAHLLASDTAKQEVSTKYLIA